MIDKSKLSIITINYNNAKGLLKTIESVVSQTFKHFEFIIIDGSSTDNSIEIIKKFSDKIDYWVSEKDNGVYDAMNKGILKASGAYLMFLNSSDYLINNNILKTVVPLLTGEDIIYGNLCITEIHKTWIKLYPDELLFSYFIEDTLPHSGGVFIKKSAFKNKLAEYDTSLKIAADWKWFLLAIFKYQYSYKHIDKVTGSFDYTGISAQPENHLIINSEKQKVLQEYYPLLFKDLQNLLELKKNYINLLNSRFVKSYLSIKRKFNLSRKHAG